ncbi:MAG TPA: hypothetical protein VM597_23500, partial [Gemmataceae bacterium]|nr:hypothetical protein [Gemmataceae bacterium]
GLENGDPAPLYHTSIGDELLDALRSRGIDANKLNTPDRVDEPGLVKKSWDVVLPTIVLATTYLTDCPTAVKDFVEALTEFLKERFGDGKRTYTLKVMSGETTTTKETKTTKVTTTSKYRTLEYTGPLEGMADKLRTELEKHLPDTD